MELEPAAPGGGVNVARVGVRPDPDADPGPGNTRDDAGSAAAEPDGVPAADPAWMSPALRAFDRSIAAFT